MQKSTVAGILSIVAGALGLIVSLLVLVFAAILPSVYNNANSPGHFSSYDQQTITILAVVYGVLGFLGLLLSTFGILGGIFAIQRKHWGWALAGAIAGCLAFLPLGIAAVVLVAMARPEFAQNVSAVPPQPSVSPPSSAI